MQVATGTVVDGKIVLEGVPLTEGARVTVVTRGADEGSALTEAQEDALLASRTLRPSRRAAAAAAARGFQLEGFSNSEDTRRFTPATAARRSIAARPANLRRS